MKLPIQVWKKNQDLGSGPNTAPNFFPERKDESRDAHLWLTLPVRGGGKSGLEWGKVESELGPGFTSFLHCQDLWGKKCARTFMSNTNFWIGTFLSRQVKRHNDRKSEKKASLGGRDIRGINP